MRQLVCQAGAVANFAEGERTLKSMSGLEVSEATVRRTTEDEGRRVVEELEQRTLGPQRPWNWQRDAEGKTCAYISVDHTGVRQQGERGRRADGRMVGVGMVYNPDSEHDDRRREPRQVRYLAGLYDLDDLGRRLRREAEAVGIMRAERQIALTDGGAGLEALVAKFFPRAELILDFYHGKEHLVELAQALFPSNDADRKSWLDARCHQLKHEGGAAVLAVLEGLAGEHHSANVRECLRCQIGYFRNNVHRMDYPAYIAKGWQIGSGPVESACKTVVGNRLKGSGMRWGAPGTSEVAHLRALYLSEPECWKAHWSTTL